VVIDSQEVGNRGGRHELAPRELLNKPTVKVLVFAGTRDAPIWNLASMWDPNALWAPLTRSLNVLVSVEVTLIASVTGVVYSADKGPREGSCSTLEGNVLS